MFALTIGKEQRQLSEQIVIAVNSVFMLKWKHYVFKEKCASQNLLGHKYSKVEQGLNPTNK